jgi:hypothetical protein
MQQYPATAPTFNDGRQLRAQFAHIHKRVEGQSIPMVAALAWARIMALRAIRYQQWKKKQLGIVSSLAPSLEYLHRLLMQQARVYIAGWLVWLCELEHVLQGEVGGRSLLLAWSPWAGRAPPVVPEVTQRQ